MDAPQVNGSWMPDFPGLADKQNCRDWKPGFQFDSTKMRDKDQAYWEKYRGTPKAFVNLRIGQQLWGNRWGNVTAIRWPAGTDKAALEKALLTKLTPDKLGFQFLDGPVTPKPEKLPAPKPRAKRRSPPRPKPKRGSVPKVPLAKV